MKRTALLRKTRLSPVSRRKRAAIRVMPDGREIVKRFTPEGLRIWLARLEQMSVRQGWICCLHGYCPTCPGPLQFCGIPDFEHEFGRRKARGRDDRIEVEVNGLKLRLNGAAHRACNQWKGSRVIAYNEAFNSRVSAPL